MKARRYMTIGMAAMLLSSCVKDKLYNTPHPDWGAVMVSLPGLTEDDDYVLDIDGKTVGITGSPFVYPDLLLPGAHSLVVYKRAEGFTFNGRIAQIHALGSKSHAEGTTIIPLPGYLKTISQDITVVADDTLRITLSPQQRVRDLHIEFRVTQGRPAFTREGDMLTADARLLGTMGTVQTLVLDIAFTDDGRTQRTEVNLTEALATFNDDMTAGFRVTGTLETPVGMEEATAEITGWETVDGGDVDAEM